MILDNFKTMQQTGKLKDEPLFKGLVFEVHRFITEKMLNNTSAPGRFRKAYERIVVGDMYLVKHGISRQKVTLERNRLNYLKDYYASKEVA